MRIGFDASKALAPRDGIGRYARELIRALIELDAGVELELFGLPEGVADEAREQLWGLPCHSGWQIEPGTLDVFHSTAWHLPPGYGSALASLRGDDGSIVFTCHDLTFLTHPECHTLDNKVHCLSGLLRANLAGAHFLAVSQATADALHEQVGIGGDRVDVIHHGLSSDLEPLPRRQARQRLRERFAVEGAPVLAVGTLEPRKNLERLLDAYAGLDGALRQAHPLVIAAGGGWKNDALLARCDEIGTAHRLDPNGDRDLSLLYSAAAVFAYPSLAEGFGLPVIEAMACGAPVITSNVSSLPEVAGDAAWLVDPLDTGDLRDALEELLANPDHRKRLRALGRRRAATFTWAETARRTLDLYRRLVRSPGGGQAAGAAEAP